MEYLGWQQDIVIEKYYNNTYALFIKEDETQALQRYIINDSAAEIINAFDGTKTIDEIESTLMEKYKENKEVVHTFVFDFVDVLSNEYGLVVKNSPQKEKSNLTIKEVDNYLKPQVASLEITERCNLKCIHCYGDYGDVKKTEMKLTDVKKVLKNLNDEGVKIVELTGGDISVHQHFYEILEYITTLNFDKVALLTNGILLSQRVLDFITAHKELFVVQIDLHSLKDDYMTWFTKVPNTLDKILNNIKYLAKRNITLRIAVIATKKNLDELVSLADWSYKQNVTSFGISIAMSMGRATTYEDGLYIEDIADADKLSQIFLEIEEKYPHYINKPGELSIDKKNCGCLTSHIVITPEGNIKLCTMDNMKYCNTNFGNMITSTLKDIISEKSEIYSLIASLNAPNKDTDECKHCEYWYFCNACITRGLVKASELKEKCGWYQNVIPNKLKVFLDI